jgi:hypothetical protein
MHFAADAMLGKLARWLRLSGYDVYYSRSAEDEELLNVAQREGRVLLTRDTTLAEKARKLGTKVVLVESNSIEEQLIQLRKELGLSYEKTPAKALCPECNGEILEVSKSEVSELVPQGVLEAHEEFYRCSQCGKVYWYGSHWRSITKRVVRIEGKVSSSEK